MANAMTESEAIRELKQAKNRLMQNAHMDNNRMMAFNMAIQALEKQVPRKMMKPYESGVDEQFGLCPVCAKGWYWARRIRRSLKYCINCGQRLDWSDEDDR